MRHLNRHIATQTIESEKDRESRLVYEVVNLPPDSKHVPMDVCRQYIRSFRARLMLEDGIINVSDNGSLSRNQLSLPLLAYELCGRLPDSDNFKNAHLTDFITAARFMRSLFKKTEYEYVHVAYLDEKMRVIQKLEVCSEGLSYVILEKNGIFLQKPNAGWCGIIVAHNHPNNSCFPSESDERTTHELEMNAPLYGMQLLDSLIVTDECVYSIMFNISYKSKNKYE